MKLIYALKEIYEKRLIKEVDSFVETYATEETVVDGTCVGEIYRGKDGLRDILKSDLRYWYDLEIQTDYQEEQYRDYTCLKVNAISYLGIHENDARYRRFVQSMDEKIQDKNLTTLQKAASISYCLDSILSSRSKKIRKDPKQVGITIILKAGRILFMNYYFKKTMDDADTFLYMNEEIDGYYQESLEELNSKENEEIREKIIAMGYHDVKINLIDSEIFFGLGLITISESLESRLERLFQEYKKDTDYESLYYLRLKISYLRELYAYAKHPEAVVKFHGFQEEFLFRDKISIVYPLYYYIESK